MAEIVVPVKVQVGDDTLVDTPVAPTPAAEPPISQSFWSKTGKRIAIIAVAWMLISPAVMIKQQFDYNGLARSTAATAHKISNVQNTNTANNVRLGNDEHVVAIAGSYLVNFDNGYLVANIDKLCAAVPSVTCVAPPSLPDLTLPKSPIKSPHAK